MNDIYSNNLDFLWRLGSTNVQVSKSLFWHTARLTSLHIALHGSSFDNRKARLAPFLSSLTGEPKPIQFSVERYDDYDSVLFKNNDHYTRSLASLDIQVMQCSSSSLCRWKKLTKDSGIYITSDIFEGQRYVIVPSSLPSIDEFDRFGRKILLASNGGHSGSITLFLDRFLMTYCSRKHNTKVVSRSTIDTPSF